MLSVVVDLGGTNIRLAVCDKTSGALSQLQEFPCADFTGIDQALSQYFAMLPSQVAHLCIAIASVVDGDEVAMLNLNWAFSIKALQQKLQLQTLYVINDYTAISLAVPFLAPSEKIQIGGGVAQIDGVTGVFGPGTGLGVSHIVKFSGKWLSLEGEGGHVSFTANTATQADILLLLQQRFGHVSAERVLSGQGLVNIYQSLCQLSGKEARFSQAQQISQAALSRQCQIAGNTLDIFCQIMGSFAGNIALNLNCTGGVYIAGGIVPRFIDFFAASEFRRYFEEKGRLQNMLAAMPTFVITHHNPGLLGASVYLRQELGEL